MPLYRADAQVYLAIALTGSADLVALTAGKKIRVLGLFGNGTTTGTIKFQTGAATDLCGAMKINDGTGIVLPYNEYGWFETAVGAKLNAVLATMTAFDGALVYVLV